MTCIAFVCALPMEVEPIACRLGLRRTTVDGLEARVGVRDGRDVVAVVTGMGTALARDRTHRLLDAVTVDAVVVVGITGAVYEATPIGTLVVPELVVDATSGAVRRPAPLAGLPAHGTMWTTDSLVTDAATLAALRERGVVSLDMETAAVADVCEQRGVQWSVVRAVSDRATDAVIDEELVGLIDPDGTPNRGAIARYVVRHPGRIRHLVRLARASKVAREAAAAAALQACMGVAP